MSDRPTSQEERALPDVLRREALPIAGDVPARDSHPPRIDSSSIDGRHGIAAALWLHPLLVDEVSGVDLSGAVDRLLPRDAPGRYATRTRRFEERPLVELGGAGALEDDLLSEVHLVLGGRVRLIEVRQQPGREGEARREIGQCRAGQWIGMPQLLRAYDRRRGQAVWEQVVKILAGETPGIRLPMPQIVCFQGATPELGTSMLAYLTATALTTAPARTAEASHGHEASQPQVYIVDLQGEHNLDKWFRKRGFDKELCRQPLAPRARGRERTELAYYRLVPSTSAAGGEEGWPERLEVVWPADLGSAGDAEALIECLTAKLEVSHIRERAGGTLAEGVF
ncbi:hypothetical protein WMF30_29110 [Sorangium sp. So ce134]